MARDYERYHTHHQSRRRPDWNYTQPAAYFVTICAHQRARLFGRVVHGKMQPNAFGQMITEEWHRSETIRAEVHLDAFVVMPNHIHGIVVIAPPEADRPTDPRGYTIHHAVAASTGRSTPPCGPQRRSLGSFIAGFKSAATRRINQLRQSPGTSVWQRNYHDHIIRNEREWHHIRQYIESNPAQWTDDMHFSTDPSTDG